MESLISTIKKELSEMYGIFSHLFCSFVLINFLSLYYFLTNYIVRLFIQEGNILIHFIELASAAIVSVSFLFYVATSFKIAINKYKE